MREILFRGKQTDKDKWIYGVPVKGTSADESEILIIESVFKCDEYACRGCEFTPAIPSTVGQYTGLKDKNGKMIFEGDIVGHYSNYRKKYDIGTVKYGDFNCSCCSGVYGWFFENEDIREHSSCEVLGNIYDNPELLKGGEV